MDSRWPSCRTARARPCLLTRRSCRISRRCSRSRWHSEQNTPGAPIMKPEPLQIVAAQVNYKVCDFAGNLAKQLAVLDRHRDADLIVFSELSTCGYYPQDLLEEPWFLQLQDEALAGLTEASKSHRAEIVAGLVTRNP